MRQTKKRGYRRPSLRRWVIIGSSCLFVLSSPPRLPAVLGLAHHPLHCFSFGRFGLHLLVEGWLFIPVSSYDAVDLSQLSEPLAIDSVHLYFEFVVDVSDQGESWWSSLET